MYTYFSHLFVFVTLSANDTKEEIKNEILNDINKEFNIFENGTTWLAHDIKLYQLGESDKKLIIGNGNLMDVSEILETKITNAALLPNTHYILNLILLNEYKEFRRYARKVFTFDTVDENFNGNRNNFYLYFLLFLFVLVPLTVWVTLRL